ncbi:MAG: alpha/beta hydrolase family protein, partial [Candidatus Accumulibacter sp.]|nr:alpha/beta hydrolase family protein [Accumulibacter sp.]
VQQKRFKKKAENSSCQVEAKITQLILPLGDFHFLHFPQRLQYSRRVFFVAAAAVPLTGNESPMK